MERLEKHCRRCDTIKPVAEFDKNRSTRDGLQSYCRLCARQVRRDYVQRNAEVMALRHAERLAKPLPASATKECRRCHVVKPLPDFYAHRTTMDGRANYCKECAKALSAEQRKRQDPDRRRAAARAWHEGNRDRARELARGWKLGLYGLTVDDYMALHDRQGGRCLICGSDGEDTARPLAVDHCHETNQVRGLLCNKCNSMLGFACDDPERLIAGAEYLRRSRLTT